MIVSFAWPSGPRRTGGVAALYEFANGLARLGHEVHFLHAPRWPNRIEHVDELSWFPFHQSLQHHIADSIEDPSLPDADVIFLDSAPRRLGLPCTFLQGARMLAPEVERQAFLAPNPKACIARWLVRLGRELGAPPEQLWHIPQGFDQRLFSARKGPAERRYHVAMLHNPHPSKGWGVGLQALQAAHRMRPDLRAVVFGAAAPRDHLPSWIDFVLHPDHEHLAREVYNEARIFVQSSFHEGFGFTAIEAMACGAALVTTDNGGSEDYAEADVTAVVVPPGDSAGLGRAVVDLLDDDRRRGELAAAGAAHVRSFDWDVGAQRLAAHLDEYVADPARFQREPDGQPPV